MTETSSTTPAPVGPRTALRRFAKTPWAIAFLLWFFAVVPTIFLGGGDLVPTPWFMLGLLAIVAAALIAIIKFIFALFRGRWRFAVSIATATMTFLGVTFISLKFHDEFRWLILRSYYVAKLTPPTALQRITWDRGQGSIVWLEYLRDDAAALDRQEQQRSEFGICTHTIKRLETNFYLIGMYC
jgi:hypothetical protein